jgi:hepatocyte growth factor-regulated tyrosine kinase substrate
MTPVASMVNSLLLHQHTEAELILFVDLLTDMNSKLSQAVKIYDRLLTEQVSRPSWQSSQPVAYAQQASASGYTPSYAPPAPVSTWSAPSQEPEPQMISSYASAVSVPTYPPSQQVASPTSYSPQQSWQPQPDAIQHRQQHSAPTPAPGHPHQVYAPVSVPPAQIHSPPPPLHVNAAASPGAPIYNPPASVSRQNTYTSYRSPQQQLQQPAPSLPSFPVAPTSPPQVTPMYNSPTPQTERKEALLIDL